MAMVGATVARSGCGSGDYRQSARGALRREVFVADGIGAGRVKGEGLQCPPAMPR
jgi:hypothetical protein